MAKDDDRSAKSSRKVKENKDIPEAQISGQGEAHNVPYMNSFKGGDL